MPARKVRFPRSSRARVDLSGLEPPCVRLGAPCFSLPSGVGVELGVGVQLGVAVQLGVGVAGTAETLGTGSDRVGLGVGVETAPLSMTSEIVPVTPGTLTWLTGVPGGTSTVASMRSPVIRTTVTECSSAAAGIAATPRPAVAAISAMMPFRRFMLIPRPPAHPTAHPARAGDRHRCPGTGAARY